MDIGQLIIVLLAIVGICALCRSLLQWMYRTGAREGVLTLALYFSGKREDAEFQVRAALRKLREMPGQFAHRQLLIVDDGMDAETCAVCRQAIEREPSACVVPRNALVHAFAKDGVLQYTKTQDGEKTRVLRGPQA